MTKKEFHKIIDAYLANIGGLLGSSLKFPEKQANDKMLLNAVRDYCDAHKIRKYTIANTFGISRSLLYYHLNVKKHIPYSHVKQLKNL